MVETKLGLLEFKKGNLTAKFSSINHKKMTLKFSNLVNLKRSC